MTHVTAIVVYESPSDGEAQTVEFSTGHRIQFGGQGGDGFCYAHQSFACLDSLGDHESAALNGD